MEEPKKGKSSKKQLPENLQLQSTHVVCGPEMNYHVGASWI
jgi:hypothetical protein